MNNFVFDPSIKFLDPEKILFAAGVSGGQTVADLGAGSGFYTVAAAKMVGEQGSVFAADVLESALDHIAADARVKNLRNIKFVRCDLESVESCQNIPAGSADFVILATIAHHLKNQSGLFKETYRLLKTGGRAVVIEWNDQPSPIGPQSSERISKSALTKLAAGANLKPAGELPTDPYHYGIVLIK